MDQMHFAFYLLYAFTSAYILHLNDSCTCPYSSPHTAISEMQMHIFTPPQALTSSDAHSMHTHTLTSEDLSMGGMSVSMETETGRQITVCVGELVLCVSKWVCVCVVSLCVSLFGSHPETDCRPGISPITTADTFTLSRCKRLLWMWWFRIYLNYLKFLSHRKIDSLTLAVRVRLQCQDATSPGLKTAAIKRGIFIFIYFFSNPILTRTMKCTKAIIYSFPTSLLEMFSTDLRKCSSR